MKRLVFALLLFSSLSAHAVDVVCGAADDTSAIQAAINAGGRVQLPGGNCHVSSLNITNRQGTVLEGQGILATNLIPLQSGVNVIDLTGSSNITLKNFHLCGTCAPGIVPSVGILSAQMQGTYASDVTAIEHVRVDGYFGIASWYNLSVASSVVHAAQFYNYQPSAMTVIFTGANYFGVTSQFVQIDTCNCYVPSDWTITGSEFHNMAGGWAMWLGGAKSVRVYGGNMSSSAPIVSNNAIIDGSGQVAMPGWLILDGTTFYSDTGQQPACAVSGISDEGHVSFRANQRSMPLTGC